MIATLASIPSPSSGALEIGPLSIHAYGLMIALGVVAAVWLTGRRLEATGLGTSEDASSMAVWAVVAGMIGARLYHVVTDWALFKDDLGRIPQIWRGRARNPRRHAPRGARRAVGLQAARRSPAGRRHRGGACTAAGPGHRAVGELVEPGAVRQADHAAVGAADRC